MSNPPSVPNSNEVNFQWIDWSNPDEVKEALKDDAEFKVEQIAATAKEVLQTVAHVGLNVAKEAAKTACEIQTENYCPAAVVPCVNYVTGDIIDDIADSSEQKIPSAVISSVDTTSEVAKNIIGKSIDTSVDSTAEVHSCVTNSLS